MPIFNRFLLLAMRTYSLLLHLYPVAFRDEYGAEMAQLFRDDMCRTWQAKGKLAVVGLWVLVLADLLRTATVEHLWEMVNMPRQKLLRFSGIAGSFGGLLFALTIALTWRLTGRSLVSPLLVAGALLLTTPFLGLGLYGLYRCLPARVNSLNRLFFALTLGGLFMLNIGSAVQMASTNLVVSWEIVVASGLFFWVVGLLGLSMMAILTHALGRWSLAPMLVTGAFIALIWAGSNGPPRNVDVLMLYAISWLLLGVAVRRSHHPVYRPSPPGH